MLYRLAPLLIALVLSSSACSKAKEAPDEQPGASAAEPAAGPMPGATDDEKPANGTATPPSDAAAARAPEPNDTGAPAATEPSAEEPPAKAAANGDGGQATDDASGAAALAGKADATGGIAQGQSCVDDKKCAKGLECIEYYGFAGPAGPKFASCEKRCKGPMDCPKGQTCTTIADGPGQVCR